MNSLIEISIVVFKQKYRLRMDILELLLFSSLILLRWIFHEDYLRSEIEKCEKYYLNLNLKLIYLLFWYW